MYTVIVTRPQEQSEELCRALSLLGCTIIASPAISVHPLHEDEIDKNVIRGLEQGRYSWIALTSANSVRFLKELNVALSDAIKIAAQGTATAQEVERCYNRSIDLLPEKAVAESFLQALLSRVTPDDHVCLPRAQETRGILAKGMHGVGINYDELVLYKTVSESLSPESIERIQQFPDTTVVTLCNPKAARSVEASLAARGLSLSQLKTVSIGPVTTATLESMGITVTHEALTQDVDGVARAVKAAICRA